jgi:branched-chain amino acid transport system permease protein
MVELVSLTINVLLLGALYSLVAIGFTLIFGVGGVLNLAHGALLTVGAYTAYYLTQFGASIWVGALGAFLVPAIVSVALYAGLIHRVRGNPVTVLILTLVVGLIVEQIVLVLTGTEPLVVSNLIEGRTTVVGDSVSNNRVTAFALSWVLIGALFAFVNYTSTGKAILATSMSERGAAVVGIDGNRMYVYTWALAGALAGIAGLFLASFQTANPFMGRSPLLLSFAIVVLGGLGSIRGSVVGAYLISFLDQVTVTMISTRLSGVSALVVLVLVLLVKPEGLFGREYTH